ncbi:MAG TPA: Lrp/AsnC ligand binding domain-containing protein [Thermoplasmata archaeon]|nr:Lrp/AsnC ligand binding domain-containing protein [Thermoplasmata archaeon]
MAVGFVLIGVEPKREREVQDRLMKVEEIVELYPLFGEYDLIAKVEADDYDKIGEVVVSKIRTITGVRATRTLAKMTF